MKISSPTISTENFKNAESYIIKGGKFLRKYSLDELPQLINILRGEMNFIGPRPSMIEGEELLFELRTKKGVDKMKPGITGWAQVNGRDSISFQQKVELDEYYLKNKSIFLNIKIILLTLKILFKTRLVKH
jgi:O-antigen biosynthesis protein WbqP